MFCSSCGKNVDDGAGFCNHCGAVIGASGSAAPPAQNYTQPQPFQQYSSVDPAQPQYQQTFFAGQQASVGTSGQVQFKGGKKKKTGCLIAIIAVVLIGILGIVGVLLLGGGEMKLSNLNMSESLNEESLAPINITSTFSPETQDIFLTGKIENASEGTEIRSEWRYLGTDPVNIIDSAEVKIEDPDSDFYFSLSPPEKGWPAGKYEVRLYVNEEYKASVEFKVTDSTQATTQDDTTKQVVTTTQKPPETKKIIINPQMAAGVDRDTNLPIVATSTFNTWTPEIDCTFESNVEPGTVFTAEWWYLEDIANPEFITDYDVMVEEKGDQVSFGLTKPDNDWPTGKYEVRIFIGEKQIETAKFTVVE